MNKVTLILSIILISNIYSDITIDFSSNLSSGDGFTVEDNIIKLENSYNHLLKGTNIDKSILVSASKKIIFDSFTLANTGKLTPLIIDKNCDVDLELRGTSSLVDSSTNENEGIIYLREGANLTIYGSGTLNLMINKFVAINGKNSSLVLNGGTIKIISTENSAGGIKLGGDIIFNGPTFLYEAFSGKNPAIFANDSIIINSGNLNIKSGEGKIFQAGNSIIMNSGQLNLETSGQIGIDVGNSIYFKGGTFNLKASSAIGIRTEKNIYFGIRDENNNNLKINIESSNKGIVTRGMEIYSGNITINSKGDGIKISNEICINEKCSGECTCYMKMYGGDIFINSDENGIDSKGDIFIIGGRLKLFGASTGDYQPITQCGLLKILNGTIFAGGSSGNEGIIANSTQYSFIYNKHIDKNSLIQIYDNENKILIVNMTNPKEIEYLYFNYPFNFTIYINGKEIENSIGNNIRTLISSEYEDLNNKLYSTINKESIIKNNKIISTIMQSNEEVKKEKTDEISTNVEKAISQIDDNISTIPLKDKENQKQIIENSEINEKMISSIPEQNKPMNKISTSLKTNIQNKEIAFPQNLNSQNIESSFSSQTIKTIIKNQIIQNNKSTIPKETPKNFLGKTTILNQNFENQDNKINGSNVPRENMEDIKDIINSGEIKISDNTSLNENNYDLAGFIKVSDILFILIELFLL